MSSILIADDDEIYQTLLKRHLERMGFHVLVESSGKFVISRIRHDRPVACLIDIVMDEKEGIETITEIADMPNKPKIVAISSHREYLDWAKQLGADDCLMKPITPDDLETTLIGLGIR